MRWFFISRLVAWFITGAFGSPMISWLADIFHKKGHLTWIGFYSTLVLAILQTIPFASWFIFRTRKSTLCSNTRLILICIIIVGGAICSAWPYLYFPLILYVTGTGELARSAVCFSLLFLPPAFVAEIFFRSFNKLAHPTITQIENGSRS